jgi:hypothetical protein
MARCVIHSHFWQRGTFPSLLLFYIPRYRDRQATFNGRSHKRGLVPDI